MEPYEELKKRAGLIWPYVKGKSTKWRYNTKCGPATKGYDSAARVESFDFYGKPDHRAWIWMRPYEAPPEMPDKQFPFWLSTGRALEHWHTGSMTQRIPILHRAMPRAYVELHPSDAKRLGIRNGNKVRITSRRGTLVLSASIDQRSRPARGNVVVPFFDENLLINEVTLDAYCPISKQPDYKKCAVAVEKV